MPKQFIPLFGADSTFQRTMKLPSDPSVFGGPIVITNEDYRFTAQDQLQAIGVSASLVLEPARRDSAAAVAAATMLASAQAEDAVVGVFAADHVVQDGQLFVRACAEAGRVAAAGRIVTIGVPPTHPATGYGYIRPGADLGGGARKVDALVEKADAARAAQILLDGYLWNSGNFIFSARTMREEFESHAPEVIGPVAESIARARRDLGFSCSTRRRSHAPRKFRSTTP